MEQPIKRAAPEMGNNSNLNVLLGGSDTINNNIPADVSESLLSEIILTLSPTDNQERRFIQHLARYPLQNTKACCISVACVNLSDLRQRTAKLLARFGLETRCVSPEKPSKNGFGEDTNQKLWALYEINAGGVNEQ